MTKPLPIDLEMAATFLAALDPSDAYTFQTFGEGAAKDHAGLRQVFHGSFEQIVPKLYQLNQQGAGVFLMVNEGDGIVHEGQKTCRTKGNVIRVRSLFVDLDGSPLQPLLSCDLVPSITVESSPDRFHAYWPITGCPLADFSGYQKNLAHKFSGDESVHDLPRVMRIPGFFHQKKEPFLSRLITPSRRQS